MSAAPEVIHTRTLAVVPQAAIAEKLRGALEAKYATVSCEVAPCPDLSEYGFVGKHLGGAADYVEVGGVMQSMFNPAKQEDRATVHGVASAIDRRTSFVIGQGAGSVCDVGCNSEWVGNATIADGTLATNGSRLGYVQDMSKLPQGVAVKVGGERGEFGCIGNLLYTDGTAGDVIAIHAKGRTDVRPEGSDPHAHDFIRYIRDAIGEFPEQMCLGGVVLVTEGRTVTHVMPPYFPPAGSKPGRSWPDMRGWSECFFESSKSLIGTTSIIGKQGAPLPEGLQWRPDHTHFWTPNNEECGHYHYDIDPARIEYKAYLVPAQRMHKVEVGGLPATWPLKKPAGKL